MNMLIYINVVLIMSLYFRRHIILINMRHYILQDIREFFLIELMHRKGH